MRPEELREVADLLYDVDDPRATPWPSPERVGLLRSHLRGLADRLDDTEGTDT